MTQHSTPFNGRKLSSKNVLPERKTSTINGISSSIINSRLDVRITNIEPIPKDIWVEVNGIKARTNGTTLFTNDGNSYYSTLNYIEAALQYDSLMVQVALCINRSKDIVFGVSPNQARIISSICTNEEGLFITDNRNDDVFIGSIASVFFLVDNNNDPIEETYWYHIPKLGVDWTRLSVVDNGTVRGTWEPPFSVANWSVLRFSGEIVQNIPRIAIDISNAISIDVYNNGVTTTSTIHEYPSGHKVIYFDLLYDAMDITTEVMAFDFTISREGVIFGKSMLVSSTDVVYHTISGKVVFDGEPVVTDFYESLFTYLGAEITMEIN